MIHCDTCGGDHRFMEICPDKPGMIDLLREWIDGERSLTHYVAVAGVVVIVMMVASVGTLL